MIIDKEPHVFEHNGYRPKDEFGIICVKITRLINQNRFEKFLRRVKKNYEKFNEIRILVYYEHFEGWDSEAFWSDLFNLNLYGPHIKRLAFIDAPREEYERHLKCESLSMDAIRAFTRAEMEEALYWVQS